MKITLFTHSAVIGVDAPLCHKSQSYVDDLLLRGEAEMLAEGAFRRPAARLRAPKGYISSDFGNEARMAASCETETNCSISSREMQANAGMAETKGEILRAQVKVKMYPRTHDERAVLAYGRWYASEQIQVSAIQ